MVRIPSEYQEVEYIESTGSQWIDTGVVPTTYTVSQLKFLAPEYNGDVIYGFFDAEATDYRFFIYNGIFMFDLGGFRLRSSSDERRNKIYEIELGNYYIKDLVTNTFYASAAKKGVSTTCTITLNNFKNTGFSKCRWYYVKIYENTELVRNFIPCYRKSDNEIGMYDTISKQFYTNSGTGTFLKGNDVTYDNINLLESRRRILLNTPHIETISDTIASFETDVATKIKGCKIHFTPIQEGEGDPSPENVRPIHGWDGVTVTACGKNLAPPLSNTDFWSIKAWFDRNGEIHNNTSYIMCDYKKALPGVIYHLTMSNNTWRGIGFYDLNYKPIGFIQYMKNIQLTSPNNTAYYRIYAQPSSVNIQLELGSEPTDYEPYNGTTLTIPFPQTIYGGYVDLVKGEVVEEYRKLEITGASGGNNGSIYNGTIGTNRYFSLSQTTGKSYNNAFDAWCDKAQKKNGSGNAVWANPNNFIWCFTLNAGNQLHIVFDNETVDITQETSTTERTQKIKEWLVENHMTFILPLATPNTYSIDPQTLKALRGMNNIWSDANGNIEVSFYTH